MGLEHKQLQGVEQGYHNSVYIALHSNCNVQKDLAIQSSVKKKYQNGTTENSLPETIVIPASSSNQPPI